jgi:cytochrome c biogenesis protein CcmG, thiol:disulfide interchange protein DsbE
MRRAVVAVAVGGVIAFVLFSAVLELRARDEAGSASGVSVANYRAVAKADGRPAPSFTLPALDGEGDISFSPPTENVVVMNFWASWCVPCRNEAPALQALWQQYGEQDIRFLGVVYRDPAAGARAFVEEFGITYPSVLDDDGQLASDYGVLGLPTTFVISPDGTIAFGFTGRIDEAVLSRAIEDVLDRQTATPGQ